ncbi:tRNA (guanosine(37)-N1)-methyltransferase TrmD [Streptomyces calidiresistens]|uniref:tRNA (guanine-N(1)-)-methyltransferase n=1 Tax=Streptomyces calidiresistens TaxID=1485586 RepID=A0A7W3T3A0_9ACTN|nr:tRNA (guanosine(37)-N1)-methyltransferase TrmD [Streptomyces calidiresistens]MBB0230149.1 tRNA (guanosine(37)-N1)-methyltransferase TrmD [Streptomyces calidiresistens]
MRLDIITIFPEYLAPLRLSLVGKAADRGVLDIRVHDLRAWTRDRHHTVDDTPYGGGPGMVMKPEPWGEALDEVLGATPAPVPGERPTHPGAEGGGTGSRGPSGPVVVVPTPSGRPFTQEIAAELADRSHLVFTPARYEGIDRRVVEEYAERAEVRELSIGDYVLAGGEAPVLVMVEAVVRLLPGVLGNAESHRDDSFAAGSMAHLLEGPVYTKPPVWRGREVPEILLGGHHGNIARWRRDRALRRTAEHRPDLLRAAPPESWDAGDRRCLAELGWEPGPDGRFGPRPGTVEE